MVFNAVRIGIGVAILAGVACLTGQDHSREPIVVTQARPAAVTRARLGLFAPAPRSALIVTVTEYAPAPRGTVSIVLGLRHTKSGVTQEIGRFGIFPNQAFRAEGPDDIQRFRIPLTPEHARLLDDNDVRLTVAVEPAGGNGEGARVVIESILWDADPGKP